MEAHARKVASGGHIGRGRHDEKLCAAASLLGTIASAGRLCAGTAFHPDNRSQSMKKIAIAGFLMGLIGYLTARVIGVARPKRLSDRRSPTA
jgi:hypothetical protein